MSAAQDSAGGPAAIRGYLVQTLVALLEINQADPPFTEITLEPAHANDQFDFVWKNAADDFAVQVKSTVNEFKKADVERWVEELQAVRKNEKCRLILVGNYHTSLHGIHNIGAVLIEKKNLDERGLFGQAAHEVAKFMHAQGLDAGTPIEHELIAESLVTRLLRYSTIRKRFTRDTYIELLTGWVRDAPWRKRIIDISRIIKYAPAELIGRENEIEILNDAWTKVRKAESPRPHVVTFFALGGEGKTSLVAKWVAELAHQDWPACDAVFAWSFYSQGAREQLAASSDLFLKEALTVFGDPEMAGSAQSAFNKGRRLAELVGQRRALLILDGLEPLQYAPTSPTKGELKDQGLAAFLKGLAAANHGLCVVTTRYSVPDLRAFWQTTAPETNLLRLSKPAGVVLLRKLGVKGTQPEFENLVEVVKGHALTLNVLGAYLHDAHAGDIRRHDTINFEVAVDEQGGHAFRVMDAYVRSFENEGEHGKRALSILRLLGLFDWPATSDCLAALWQPPAIQGLTEPLVGMGEAQRNIALARLEAAKLLTVNRDAAGAVVSLDAHPLICEYFARQLRTRHIGVWQTAHRRLYEHLCATTADKPQPALEDLQPLYQAVAHGCQAGMYQEACDLVYVNRIKRRDEVYNTNKLGAFGSDLGAVSCFFDQPWSLLSPFLPEDARAWLLMVAGFDLRALGRLTEALVPMRAGLAIELKREDWKNAAARAHNLSELELMLGNVSGASEDAEKSVNYAFGKKNDFSQLVTFHRLAEPLSNNIYALHTTRTDFYPHQFKPLLKFLDSPNQRMLIADEVGLGKELITKAD